MLCRHVTIPAGTPIPTELMQVPLCKRDTPARDSGARLRIADEWNCPGRKSAVRDDSCAEDSSSSCPVTPGSVIATRTTGIAVRQNLFSAGTRIRSMGVFIEFVTATCRISGKYWKKFSNASLGVFSIHHSKAYRRLFQRLRAPLPKPIRRKQRQRFVQLRREFR
jgi:hypothetical protein